MTVALRYDNTLQYADLVFENNAFLTGDPLETAVLISLFTRRRKNPDDEDPRATFHGGWWGDTYRGFKIGSRLWLLRRRKATRDALVDAKKYIEEALAWMLTDGVASKIEVVTERNLQRMDLLLFSVTIQRPGTASPWQRTWQVQFDEL